MSEAGWPVGIRDPGSISWAAGNEDLAFENLTPGELRIFDRDLVKIGKAYSLSRDLLSVFLEDRDTYLYAAAIAKKQLNAGFGGANAGSGKIAMSAIRPVTILGAANWFQTFATAGWNNLWGSSGSPVDLGSTSSTYLNPQNRVVLVIPKIIDYCVPKCLEMYAVVGPTTYPIHSIGFISAGDLFVANLPYSIFVGKNGKFYTRFKTVAAGVQEGVAPLGLMLCLAEYITGSGQE
ncbi:MAG: hypothetical protein QW587_04630 [Candidatus Bathyarchaeia archaeon]